MKHFIEEQFSEGIVSRREEFSEGIVSCTKLSQVEVWGHFFLLWFVPHFNLPVKGLYKYLLKTIIFNYEWSLFIDFLHDMEHTSLQGASTISTILGVNPYVHFDSKLADRIEVFK